MGTDKMSDYSVSGMLKAVKEINENIDDDKTKGIILIGEEQYIDYISYFISLTVEDKKPLIHCHRIVWLTKMYLMYLMFLL